MSDKTDTSGANSHVREMSATERLRALLDERGVEWRKAPHYSRESQDNETIFEGNGIEWYANDHMNGRLGLRALRYEVTPEQAVAATLGRGTCHRVMYKPTNTLVCSECGAGMPKQLDRYCYLHYCPNCGRKVVE